MARRLALALALVAALLPVSGAGGSPAQTPKRGGTVVVGDAYLFSEPACLNYVRIACGPDLFIEEVLEGAFEFGGGVVRSNLVSHVDYTTRPPFTLTYHIRPEARWSDGEPVTARDFVFRHTAIIRHWPADLEFDHRTYVRSVRAVDPKTVRVVLGSRFGGFRWLFRIVLPSHALAGEDLLQVWRDRLDNPKTGSPIGSGPFLVERWDRGRQIVLRRNERYWGRPAHLDRVILRVGAETSLRALGEKAIAGLASGEIDVHHRRGDPALESDFRRLRGVRHLSEPGEGWEHFAIRVNPPGGHPALRKKLVRRALAYGIDRAAIVRDVYGQLAPGMGPSESAILRPDSPYYRPNWSAYRYRPALARRLLEQAGCLRGADGIYSCDGHRLRLRFATIGGVPRRARVLELVPGQLRAAGIEVVPIYAGGSFFSQLLPSGEWDVAVFLFFKEVDPLFLAQTYGCGGQSNFMAYCQRLVTDDLAVADRTYDAAAKARVLNRADARMARDVPLIPLWQEPAVATISSDVRGLIPAFPLLAWNAEDWWLDD